MSGLTRCTPVVARPLDTGQGSATVRIGSAEPVLAGHYPGFPIFPGVCVVECAIAAALASPPPGAGRLRLAALESVRFLGPVFPDDEIELGFEWSPDANGWRCAATASTPRGAAASVRALFQQGQSS